MDTTIESVWNKAQRLSAADRLALSHKLLESVRETENERRNRVATEIDKFFGGWRHDERSTDEIMSQIRASRTKNNLHTTIDGYE